MHNELPLGIQTHLSHDGLMDNTMRSDKHLKHSRTLRTLKGIIQKRYNINGKLHGERDTWDGTWNDKFSYLTSRFMVAEGQSILMPMVRRDLGEST